MMRDSPIWNFRWGWREVRWRDQGMLFQIVFSFIAFLSIWLFVTFAPHDILFRNPSLAKLIDVTAVFFPQIDWITRMQNPCSPNFCAYPTYAQPARIAAALGWCVATPFFIVLTYCLRIDVPRDESTDALSIKRFFGILGMAAICLFLPWNLSYIEMHQLRSGRPFLYPMGFSLLLTAGCLVAGVWIAHLIHMIRVWSKS